MCFISARNQCPDSFLVCAVIKMEEHLQKLVEHVEPKPSYNIIVTGNTSRLRTVFNPPLVFDGGSCHYEMALMKLETYCTFPNINVTNNSVNISISKGVTWKAINIPIGGYQIKAINDVLQRLIVDVAGGKHCSFTTRQHTNTVYWI